ncbi:probable LRR receptor-like serine/threonine-protein kinase At1g53440 isoform X2 [Arachis ipaensis]|uniref:probable LRR receptor-like serine/threonine-protein kinase At1g53440 isoform X2 n=1 Tax=Arachis ipaensis TaxID=130454 RepID=UPI000A2B5984|nr:probable LRR receptor-like serine/threonine-protein kinase At1g53440 isoform X2 [Arachis ipaensis]
MILKCLGFCGWKKKESSSSKRKYKTVIEELCHQFCMEDIRKATNNFDKKLLILQDDSYCSVYKGCLEYNGTTEYTIAVKPGRDTIRSYMVKEIEVLCQLRHPNIISLIGFCDNENEMIVVYEYMANGSLGDYLSKRKKEPLSWNKRLEICIGAARALHYLHAGAKRTIFHRFIQPANILLDENMVPKLTNFETSLQGPLSTSKPKPIIDIIRGTIGYIPDEVLTLGIYTDKCDVYSFGKVLLDVICGTKDEDLMNKINMLASLHFGEKTNEYLEHFPPSKLLCSWIPMEEMVDPDLNGKIAPECWDAVMSIAQRCIDYEADERPTMGEVELLLESALSLQQQSDITHSSAVHYTLSSTTYIHMQPSICIHANNIEDMLNHQFPLPDIREMTNNFDDDYGIMGKGSFGEMYRGRVRLNGVTDNYYYWIAIKKMDWPSICDSGMQFNFRKEIEKICVLRHPNLVSLLGFCDDDDDDNDDDDDLDDSVDNDNDDDAKILVSEFIQNGSLLYNLHDSHRNKKALTWKKRLQICIGVAQGLHYLHTASIFHRNIKLTNILLDRAMVPKLSDFGFPWSNPIHAVLLQVVFTSKLPLIEGESDPILKGKIAPQCWEVFLDITQRCLKFEANERPTMNEVISQLEHALALQEEADANTSDEYNLLSMTFDDDVLLGRALC